MFIYLSIINQLLSSIILSSAYQVQNITTNISILTLSGTTPVMEVNNLIIFQQRVDNSLSWDLPWTPYRNGFGSLGGDYWMGSEKFHLLTPSGRYMLRMEMMSTTIGWVSAEYTYFYLDNETQWYKLHLGGFSGDCGYDSIQYTNAWSEGWYYHNGMNFTTSDQDHDEDPVDNCATIWYSGWWYSRCQWLNLNGYWSSYFYVWTVPNPSTNAYLGASRMMIKLMT